MRIRPSHRRTLIVFACSLILQAMVGQLNHYLASHQLAAWLGGLFITFSALCLAPQQGLNASFLIGLLLDAVTPLPFGTHAFLFCLTHLFILRIRSRVAVTETAIRITVALIANLLLYVVITFITFAQTTGVSVSGLRIFIDLLFSQCLLVLLAPWYFALQEHALEFARVGLRAEAPPTI